MIWFPFKESSFYGKQFKLDILLKRSCTAMVTFININCVILVDVHLYLSYRNQEVFLLSFLYYELSVLYNVMLWGGSNSIDRVKPWVRSYLLKAPARNSQIPCNKPKEATTGASPDTLVLEQAQAALDDDVLQDGSGRDIDGAALGGNDDDSALQRDTAAQVDGTGDGEVVQLDDLGDGGDVLLEVGDLLEVATKLDERSITEAAGAHL